MQILKATALESKSGGSGAKGAANISQKRLPLNPRRSYFLSRRENGEEPQQVLNHH
jgi:hypothetical protein